MSRATRNSCIKIAIQTAFCTLLLIKFSNTGFDKSFIFLINDKQGGVCSHTLLCDYHELLEDLLHFFFQPVHMPVNRLFGNLQIPGYFMSAIPLDLHQNDLKGKPVHGDQHMIQFLILNTIQKVLYCFQFCLICGCCYGIQICTCSI
mgnify:CR=1 FL=1